MLGVAFSGFFDGVLLHQVLQWHHLLSLVPGERLQDPRVQIFADGLFHALMYAVALAGVSIITRKPGAAGERRTFWATFILGFGVWNVVDVVLFHWVLGIHHIRVDVPRPAWLAWDLSWLALFGALPVLIAWALSGGRGSGPSGRGTVAASVALVVTFGAWSLRPPAASAETVVIFPPSWSDSRMVSAIAAEGGRVLAAGPRGLFVVRADPGAQLWRLYGRGALVVGGAGPAGCAAWSTREDAPTSRAS